MSALWLTIEGILAELYSVTVSVEPNLEELCISPSVPVKARQVWIRSIKKKKKSYQMTLGTQTY